METETQKKLVPLNKADLQNLIAFGNRAQMSGLEADSWVELKQRLVMEFSNAADAADEEEKQMHLAVDNDAE